MQLLKQVRDWRSYVTAPHQCDIWWSNRRSWSVLGEQRSWRETIEVLHDVIRREDWSELGECDRLRLLGLTSGEDLALLGRMRRIAFNTVFGANLGTIQTIVRNIAKAKDAAFPQLAFDAYEALRDVDGVGEGIATRLLTLARPDRFISLNNASRARLADFVDLAPTTLGKPKNYIRLLQRIYIQEWYREPIPRNAHERTISRMRAALLDCFVYDDQDSG